jgi:hypothetical protein
VSGIARLALNGLKQVVKGDMKLGGSEAGVEVENECNAS